MRTNPSFGSIGQQAMMQVQKMLPDIRQRLFNEQSQYAPQSSSVSMPPLNQMVAQQAPQTNQQQQFNPMAIAQMLRGRMSSLPNMAKGQIPAFGQLNSMLNQGSVFGQLNPMTRNMGAMDTFGQGINPIGNRSAYLNFLNSMSGG